jgi:hypothetical protein
VSDEETRKTAERISDLADAVSAACHTIMGEMIDGSDLSERDKIAAGITAITALYSGLFSAAVRHGHNGIADLTMKMFTGHVAPAVEELATDMLKKRSSND